MHKLEETANPPSPPPPELWRPWSGSGTGSGSSLTRTNSPTAVQESLTTINVTTEPHNNMQEFKVVNQGLVRAPAPAPLVPVNTNLLDTGARPGQFYSQQQHGNQALDLSASKSTQFVLHPFNGGTIHYLGPSSTISIPNPSPMAMIPTSSNNTLVTCPNQINNNTFVAYPVPVNNNTFVAYPNPVNNNVKTSVTPTNHLPVSIVLRDDNTSGRKPGSMPSPRRRVNVKDNEIKSLREQLERTEGENRLLKEQLNQMHHLYWEVVSEYDHYVGRSIATANLQFLASLALTRIDQNQTQNQN